MSNAKNAATLSLSDRVALSLKKRGDRRVAVTAFESGGRVSKRDVEALSAARPSGSALLALLAQPKKTKT